MKTVIYLISPLTWDDYNIENVYKDKDSDLNMESQDKADMGYGACSGGGFISLVQYMLTLMPTMN